MNHAKAALAVAEHVGTDRFVPLALSTIAGAALLRGDLDEAARNIEAGRTVRAARTGFGSGTYAWIEARLAESRGGPSAAVEAASSIYGDLVRHKRLLVEEPAAAAWLVRVALGVGNKSRAQMVVACAQQLAADNDGVASVEIAAIHAHGLFDRAPGALARAAADHRDPWARASAFEDLSGVLGDVNPRSGASPHFERALTSYEEAGADRDASRLRRKLRRASTADCGDRPVQGWASLTPTEGRVASEVSEGMTNRKVAEHMHLSPHTVDFHLRHIFRKLDISSRVELARIVLARIESSRARTA
jgi:DNA-binding CsgD family transcriptional regulator